MAADDCGSAPPPSTYIGVLTLEAAIIALLWILGRIYA
jgi:hypothetical protein